MPGQVSGSYKLSEMVSNPMMGNEPKMPKQSVGAGVTPQGKSYRRPSNAMEPMGMADSRKKGSY